MTLRQTVIASLVAITALIYSLLIEPQWIEVTRHSKDIGLGVGEITIAQVSDLHTSSLGRAEKHTLETALTKVSLKVDSTLGKYRRALQHRPYQPSKLTAPPVHCRRVAVAPLLRPT